LLAEGYWSTLSGSVVAAFTALVGYLLNGAAGRRMERMRRYADALDAVERYRQLPYTLRRRHNETAEMRDEMARLIADVQVALAFHRRWLRLEAEELGDAYDKLVDKIQIKNKGYRKDALALPPAGKDVDINVSPGYQFDEDDERDECLRICASTSVSRATSSESRSAPLRCSPRGSA
jgi:hypothetical protein